MDPLTASVAIGAGSALLGGHISSRESRRANEMNVRQQERFAKHGIRWKVEDAKRAGVSPEFALGAPGASFTPTSTASSRGDMIADAGQNIARSVLATEDKATRELDAKMKAETLRGMQLNNDILTTQLTSINRPGNPPFPSGGPSVTQGGISSGVYSDVPLERTGQSRSARHSEGASIPSVGWAETADGGLRPVPSQDIKNRIEDQIVPETIWALQHQIAPNFGAGPRPPKEALKHPSHHWSWSHSRQAWYSRRKPKKLMYDRGVGGLMMNW